MTNDKDARIAALEAQLAEKVKVKPLEWRGTEGVWAKADALFGATYRITEYAGMAKPFKLETVGFVGLNGHYGLLDEAKAAAQADYESRIHSALSDAVAEREAEPVASVAEVRADGQRLYNTVYPSDALDKFPIGTLLYTTPPTSELEALRKRVAELEKALEWYEDKVADCRKLTKEGDSARADLDRDGGTIARRVREGGKVE